MLGQEDKNCWNFQVKEDLKKCGSLPPRFPNLYAKHRRPRAFPGHAGHSHLMCVPSPRSQMFRKRVSGMDQSVEFSNGLWLVNHNIRSHPDYQDVGKMGTNVRTPSALAWLSQHRTELVCYQMCFFWGWWWTDVDADAPTDLFSLKNVSPGENHLFFEYLRFSACFKSESEHGPFTTPPGNLLPCSVTSSRGTQPPPLDFIFTETALRSLRKPSSFPDVGVKPVQGSWSSIIIDLNTCLSLSLVERWVYVFINIYCLTCHRGSRSLYYAAERINSIERRRFTFGNSTFRENHCLAEQSSPFTLVLEMET